MSELPFPLRGGSASFRPLEPAHFRALDHGPSLKGLLKPFKGKGDLLAWSHDCAQLRDALAGLAERHVLSQTTAYPFIALRVQLSRQKTAAGTVMLRWRAVDRSAMGFGAWNELLADSRTPPALLPALLAIEHQRITLNMQISVVHTLARHAALCADQFARADAAYLARTG